MSANTKKITKKEQLTTLRDIVDLAEENGFEVTGTTFNELRGFIDNEITLLDNKAAAAKERAAKKREEGDQLRERVYDVLNTESYMTIAEIVSAIDDPDVSPAMVTSRLTQLSKLDRVEKDSISVASATEGGKSKKLSAYRRKA